MIKIIPSDIKNCNNDIFGEWVEDDNIDKKYKNNPFGHIIINNFLKMIMLRKFLINFQMITIICGNIIIHLK